MILVTYPPASASHQDAVDVNAAPIVVNMEMLCVIEEKWCIVEQRMKDTVAYEFRSVCTEINIMGAIYKIGATCDQVMTTIKQLHQAVRDQPQILVPTGPSGPVRGRPH